MGSTKESDAASRKSSTVAIPARSHEIDEGLWRRFRTWPRLSLWALALSVPILLYGYDNVIVGNITSVPEFQFVPPDHAPEVFIADSPGNTLASGSTTATSSRQTGSPSGASQVQ